MLDTYTPVDGPNAGVAYKMPPFKAEQGGGGTESHLLQLADTGQGLERGEGLHFAEGAGMTFKEHGELTGTFEISESYLVQQQAAGFTHYTINGAGLHTAVLDFVFAVVMGGMGVLVDDFAGSPSEAGVRLGNGGGVVTHRTVTCRIVGTFSYVPNSYAIPNAELTVTLKAGVPYWTYQPMNVQVPFF